MKKGWQTKKLGEICGFVRGPFGGSLKKSVFVADGFAVYEQQHAIYDQFDDIRYFIDDAKFHEMQRFELRPNDLIMSCSGTMGKVAIVPENIQRGIINQALLKLTPTKTVSTEFLKYWMDSPVFQDSLKEQSGGAAIQNVASVSILKEIQISLPPLSEQQRIVGLLDEAFEGLATAKANAEKNLQNARALFESHLQSVFTQRGPGWVETTIGETCTLRSGTTVSPTLETPIGDIPYLKVADMTFDGNEDQITTSSRFLRDADVRESAIIPKGATIFPKRGGAILTNKKRITSLPICADLNIMAVIPSSQIDAGLLYFYFLNVDMRKLGTGSSIPQINNYDVAPLRISFPKSLTTQEQIVSKLESLREETQRLARLYDQKLAALEALKKSLLHQAFTGEL